MITLDLNQHNPNDTIPADVSIRLNEVIKHIFKSKKCTVLTGAGISCNAGIPDFRSSNGLYNLVKSKHPRTVVKGKDLFDISLFRDEISLSIFCTFMESLYKSSLKARPTETHKFIKILKDKNKLLRCYTQNIDSLEKSINLNLGINLQEFDNSKKFNEIWKSLDVVQLHGNLHKLSCTHCFSNFDWNKDYQILLSQGINPQCSNCYAKYEERLYSGKRITGNIGMLRPDIVLYGEHHPQSEILSQGLNVDLRSRPDLLIIMGTSLKVDGVKKLVKSLSQSIHDKNGKVIFINKTSLSKQWDNYIDYEILCDCDDFIHILKKEIPDLFLTQEQLDSKKLKNNQILGEDIKEEKKIGVKQEIKSEITIKQEIIKQEVKEEEEGRIILTPPTTPLKKRIRPSNPPTLKRQQQQSGNKKIKTESRLATPTSSFNEDEDVDDDKPLKDLTDSRLNRGTGRMNMNMKKEMRNRSVIVID